MDLAKFAPWNWFKDEDEQHVTAPLRVDRPLAGGKTIEPYHPFYHFQRRMDELLNSFTRDFGSTSWPGSATGGPIGKSFFKPSVNIGSTEKEYSISVEIPGVDEKDIKVEVRDNTLTISGEKHQETEDKKKDFYRIERSYGAFHRILTLPEDADRDSIKASFGKGVLTLTIAKRALPGSSVKKIEIAGTD